jgi:hypothetical protein
MWVSRCLRTLNQIFRGLRTLHQIFHGLRTLHQIFRGLRTLLQIFLLYLKLLFECIEHKHNQDVRKGRWIHKERIRWTPIYCCDQTDWRRQLTDRFVNMQQDLQTNLSLWLANILSYLLTYLLTYLPINDWIKLRRLKSPHAYHFKICLW